jgi:hypothetical protein
LNSSIAVDHHKSIYSNINYKTPES